MKKVILLLLVTALLMFVFSACGTRTKEISVYYKNAQSNSLAEEKRSLGSELSKKGASAEDIAKFAVNELIKGPLSENNEALINKEAKLLKLEIKDRVATVNISSHYEEKTGVDELLLRFALVKTLCSIEGIDAIVILVDGKPLTDNTGKEVGLLKLSDIVAPGEELIKEEAVIVLYFPDNEEGKLKREERTVEVQNALSLEKTVINELIKGPAKKELSSSIPAATKLLGIETKDNVCFVNFSNEFVSKANSGSMATTLTLYSVVNSLCALENVESVQILINGETGVEFGNFVLDIPYEANEDFIG